MTTLKTKESGDDVGRLAGRALLERFAPASVVIDRRQRIRYQHGRLRDYLDFPSGAPTHDLPALALAELREPLRTLIDQIADTGEPELDATVPRVARGDVEVAVRLAVRRLDDAGEPLYLVSFRDEPRDLRYELEEKVAQLEAVNDDLQNLLESLEVGTLFLDPELRIRRFTPLVTELLNVRDGDVGRPLGELAPRVRDSSLHAEARTVLERREPREKKVASDDGRWFLRRILPYRTARDEVGGVVVTFHDVSGLEQANRKLETRERQQAWIAHLGKLAIEGTTLDCLFHEATRLVADGLGVKFSTVLELRPGGEELLLRAGFGWRQGLVGSATVPTGVDSQAGYTLRSVEPVVTDDVRREERFRLPALLRDHGIVSGLSVVIGTHKAPWGIFGAHADHARGYDVYDVNFVQAAASVLAEAIVRQRAERRLEERVRELELLHRATSAAAETTSLEEALQGCVDAVCELAGWLVGHVFLPAGDPPRMISSGIWHLENGEDLETLRRISSSVEFAPGEAFIGKIWETGEPLWLTDLGQEPMFKRRQLGGIGLRGAFGFPITVRGETMAVLEFFTSEALAPDERLLRTVRALAEQVGRVMERRRTEPERDDAVEHDRPAAGSREAPDAEERAPEPASGPVVADGSSILVVDDNRDAAWSLSVLLERQGYRVQVAATGGEALEMAAAERPAVVLLDLGLPDIDGYEVARTLRGSNGGSAMRLVAVTGYGHREAKEKAREAGFDAHLLKPFDYPQLLELLSGAPAAR